MGPAAATAARHPDGAVDLSVGTPVDPTPAVVRAALRAAEDAPGYPPAGGTAALRAAAAEWLGRLGVAVDVDAVLPTIGSKEAVAWLPTLLGLGPGDVVVHPALAYPTYRAGAVLAGCEPVASDSLTALGPRRVALLWVNSPANPTGRVAPVGHLRKVVAWAREHGAVVASDECYLELFYDEQRPRSVLDPEVCDGDHTGLLALHSLSKRSNLAGYRAGLVAGDPALVAALRTVRRHAGMMVPAPVQAAMAAAFGDDRHVAEQRDRYAARRRALAGALSAAGFAVEVEGTAGLYLWASRGEPCWSTVDWLAGRGILVAPGDFYGPSGDRHVRVSLTATDERVAAAVARLAG